MLNNFIAQAICTATAEAFAVGQRAGIDPHKLAELVSAGAVNSGLFQAMAKTLALASALGHGKKCAPSLVEAQEQITGGTIVRR